MKKLLAVLVTLLTMHSAAPAESKVGGRWILQNHFNEIVTDQHFKGKFRLIFFGYTFCPDVCPTALSNVSDALDILDKTPGFKEDIQPLFVSVDPERDTAGVLREYVKNFHPKIIGLTGNKSSIEHVTKLFKVKYEIAPESKGKEDEYYLIDHSAGVYFMSPNGYFISKFAHGISGQQIADKILKILEENPAE